MRHEVVSKHQEFYDQLTKAMDGDGPADPPEVMQRVAVFVKAQGYEYQIGANKDGFPNISAWLKKYKPGLPPTVQIQCKA